MNRPLTFYNSAANLQNRPNGYLMRLFKLTICSNELSLRLRVNDFCIEGKIGSIPRSISFLYCFLKLSPIFICLDNALLSILLVLEFLESNLLLYAAITSNRTNLPCFFTIVNLSIRFFLVQITQTFGNGTLIFGYEHYWANILFWLEFLP